MARKRTVESFCALPTDEGLHSTLPSAYHKAGSDDAGNPYRGGDIGRRPWPGCHRQPQEALTADEPDLTTVQYVKRWFLKKLPTMAGLVTGVLVNPIVGKLVQCARDAALAGLQEVAAE